MVRSPSGLGMMTPRSHLEDRWFVSTPEYEFSGQPTKRNDDRGAGREDDTRYKYSKDQNLESNAPPLHENP
eukprot:jgi/Psemu1/55086/gm1.55086_g